jgi:DNA-binding transcriptional MerR regulator
LADRYTADEVARLLISAGFDITKRTINYYTFEKKLFDVQEGKKCFTNIEIDKIQAIVLLRERTDFSLEEIKEIINAYNLDEIKRQYPSKRPQFKSFAVNDRTVEYKVDIYDKHIILRIDSLKVLLGTGATKSIGPSPFEFLGKQYQIDSSFMGTNVTEISQMLGTEIDVLLGADILGQYYFVVDLDNKRITFSTVPLNYRGQPHPIELALDIPMIQFELEGKSRKAFLDISAKVSYLRNELLQRYPLVKKGMDFYPGIGPYDVDIHDVPIKVGDAHLAHRFGTLPNSLEIALLMAGCDGILGYDLFRYYSSMYFNLQGRLVTFTSRSVPLVSEEGT